jgi:5-methylcytosine-specific restriction enzyme A
MCGHIDSDGTMCAELVRGERYCPDHKPLHQWQRVDRKRTGTGAHKTRRLRVLRRDDYECQIRYDLICLGTATELDHIIALGEGGADSDENGQSACRPCQLKKASNEGGRAHGYAVTEPVRVAKPVASPGYPRVIQSGGAAPDGRAQRTTYPT